MVMSLYQHRLPSKLIFFLALTGERCLKSNWLNYLFLANTFVILHEMYQRKQKRIII